MSTSLYIMVVVSLAALAVGITTEERPSHAQSRRIQAGPGANHFYSGRQTNRRVRPSLPAPPYAVQMEPLVQYSQRDPLYHHRQDLANITSHNSIEEKVLRVDHDQEGTSLNEAYGHPSDFQNYHQHYYREPEPIIEIIIKESNETLPAPPPPPVIPVKPTKEPVHVFYVKYKKNPKGKGDDDIIYEAPVPAITPPTDEVEHDSSPQVSDTVYESASVAPPPSTTLRTIIHPDSEVYHGSSLKVTFGETEVKTPDAAYEETNSPEPSIALPHKEAQSRESNSHVNVHTPIKRQGTYQTIPQEVYDQNPPKVASSPQSTFQNPVGKFQQNSFQQQNLQHVQFQQPQSQQQKVNFPRQVSVNQQPAFRPQHTSALFNNQQQHHQQFNQRPQPQFQPQPSQIHQRQVPRQQSNPYSTIQSPTQNHQQQQSAQFRVPSQQFDQRPSQYSQPLNNPQSQRQLLPSQDPQILHQQQIAQQQQIQQQQAAQGQFRNQPVKVANQDFSHYNPLQGFPTFQPQNTPIPLPSKPIHPLYAQHYHQQINLAQQQRQNFVPSTYQPQPQPQPQQGIQQQHQQHYRFPQQTISIPQQPSTPKPEQSFQHTTPRPQPSIVNKYQDNPIIPDLSDAQVIKSISQSEEHLLQPQYNQKTLLQNNQQTTIDQINQLNQLRNQQASQLNHQLLNQQQINHQFYQQQQNQQQQNQQQFSNDFTNQQQYVPQNNQQRPSQYSHPNQLVSTTSQPVKSSSASYQTKYTQVYSHTPSTTPTPTEETPTTTTEDPEKVKEKQKKFKANLAALPDEVPDDIREQLLSSGILSNADISILDYDKIGDIPIENLPPEALENFYGAASAPVPAVVAPDNVPAASESEGVEMKVVRYDPSTKEGQNVEDAYIKEDATQVDSVILNDSKYNRYLPLKVSGSNFPLPDESVLAGRRVNSVVVLAPVDYDFVKQAEEEEQRSGRAAPVQVQGVRFIAGNILKNLIKDPTEQNYKSWLAKEKSIPTDKQSVVLLVVSRDSKKPDDKEIYMYDIGSEKLSRLRGELSTAFVEVAENNAKSQELDDLADVEGAASSLQPVRVPPPPSIREKQDTLETVKTEDLVMAASETDENIVYQAPTISSGYSKMAVQ